MSRGLAYAAFAIAPLVCAHSWAACGSDDYVSSTGCLLELGEAPTGAGLIPGLSNGSIDPAAVSKAAGTGVAIRTWSGPDPREPGIVQNNIHISGSLIDVLGAHEGSPPYMLTELAVRDPNVALPCGLRIGQPLKAFASAPSIDVGPERRDPKRGIRLDWAKYVDRGSFCSASHANIFLRLTPTEDVREVRWEYFAD